MTASVRSVYEARLQAARARAEREARRDRVTSYARLVAFGSGVLALALFGVSLEVAVFPLAAFLTLVVVHARVLRSKERAERAVRFYESGLARLDDRWVGDGDPGERFVDDEHLYSRDLDLFGRGSLFELLSAARTRRGQDVLARFLQAPASVPEIRLRQEAVRELTPALDLREALAVAGGDVGASVNPETLATWGKAPAVLEGRWIPVAASLLSFFAVGSIALYAADLIGPLLVEVALALALAFAGALRSRVRRVIREVEEPARELLLLTETLALVERHPVSAPRLVAISERLGQGSRAPSVEIARLRRFVDFLDGRRNPLVAPVLAILLWATQLAYAIEAWRSKHGKHVDDWLEALGELEALSSFGRLAYERPDDVFPEILEGPAAFRAVGLGHPLLARDRLVRNDFVLDDALRLLIVSGSNMSGKSTLLRTAGVSTVLALAGAPVRAVRLSLSPLAASASIRIQDSLQAGVSRFYAEITRLRHIVDLTTGPLPVLFLLDEVLQGTNSHDRRVGAEAVVRGLLDRGALGLITTHDLALAQIADAVAPRAANVHFEDHIEDGVIRFDYRLRPGVVQKSNAIALMRAVGLEV